MEIQLQELIDQIKKDGVETAQTQADAIIKAAKSEADKIIADAKATAEKMLLDAKNENQKTVKSSEDAIRQAGRNLLISFRDSVARQLKAVLSENVAAVYSSDALAKIITNAVSAWAEKPEADDISIILNSKDAQQLEQTLLAALKDNISKGITLKPSDNFDGGFRIGVNDCDAYYDYSTEAVVDMLSNYLSPRVTALLKEAE